MISFAFARVRRSRPPSTETRATGVFRSRPRWFRTAEPSSGFAAGSRCFVCDNLAFRSEVVVARKHTKNGQFRFAEALTQAVSSLHQFRQVEMERIKRMQQTPLADDAAALYCLQAFDRDIVSHTSSRGALNVRVRTIVVSVGVEICRFLGEVAGMAFMVWSW